MKYCLHARRLDTRVSGVLFDLTPFLTLIMLFNSGPPTSVPTPSFTSTSPLTPQATGSL